MPEAVPENPWRLHRAKTWKEHVPELGFEVEFTGAGDAGFLIDLTTGGVNPEAKTAALARFVCSSIINPPLEEPDWYALDIKAKTALYVSALKGVNVPKDFSNAPQPGLSQEGATTPQLLETPAGGSGARPRPSASVIPTGSKES